MALADDVNIEEFVMAKDELSGADITGHVHRGGAARAAGAAHVRHPGGLCQGKGEALLGAWYEEGGGVPVPGLWGFDQSSVRVNIPAAGGWEPGSESAWC